MDRIELPMFYHIKMSITPGQNKGLWIDLSPEWKKLVEQGYIRQEQVNTFRESMGAIFLRDLGFTSFLDCHRYRVDWGEWGPEHITVPGDACGLDIGDACGMTFWGGRRLSPHNIDTNAQVLLLLQTFLWFADSLILHRIVKGE